MAKTKSEQMAAGVEAQKKKAEVRRKRRSESKEKTSGEKPKKAKMTIPRVKRDASSKETEDNTNQPKPSSTTDPKPCSTEDPKPSSTEDPENVTKITLKYYVSSIDPAFDEEDRTWITNQVYLIKGFKQILSLSRRGGIIVDGVRYRSMLHFLAICELVFSGIKDKKLEQELQMTSFPGETRKIIKEYKKKHCIKDDFRSLKKMIAEKLVIAIKALVNQYPDARKELESVGDRLVGYAVEKETIYGIGIDIDSDFALDHTMWEDNLYGKALMAVSEEMFGKKKATKRPMKMGPIIPDKKTDEKKKNKKKTSDVEEDDDDKDSEKDDDTHKGSGESDASDDDESDDNVDEDDDNDDEESGEGGEKADELEGVTGKNTVGESENVAGGGDGKTVEGQEALVGK